MLLDWDVCVAILRPRASPAKAKLNAALLEGRLLAISSIGLVELTAGARKSRQPDLALDVLGTFLDRLTILPFDDTDAHRAGQIRGSLEAGGRPIGPYDLLIGAQALNRGLTLATGNVREMARIDGLDIENWLA